MELKKKVKHFQLDFGPRAISLDRGIEIVEGKNTESQASVLVYCLPIAIIDNKMTFKKFCSLFQRQDFTRYPKFNTIQQTDNYIYFFFDMMTLIDIQQSPHYHQQIRQLRHLTRFPSVCFFLQNTPPRIRILPSYDEASVQAMMNETQMQVMTEPEEGTGWIELQEQGDQYFEEIPMYEKLNPEQDQQRQKQFQKRMQIIASKYSETPKQLEQFSREQISPEELSEQLSKLFLEVEMEKNTRTIIIEDPQIRSSRLRQIISKNRIFINRFQYCYSIFDLFLKTFKSYAITNKAKNEPRSLMIAYMLCLISFLMLKKLYQDLRERKDIFNIKIPKELTYDLYIRRVEESLCEHIKWIKTLKPLIQINFQQKRPQYCQDRLKQIKLIQLKNDCINAMKNYVRKNRRQSYRELLTLQTLQVLIQTFEDNNYCCHTYDNKKLPPTWDNQYYSYLKVRLSAMIPDLKF